MRLNWRGNRPVIQTVCGDVFVAGQAAAVEAVIEFFRKFEEVASVSLEHGAIGIVDEEALRLEQELKELQRECEAKADDVAFAVGVMTSMLSEARDAARQVLDVLWTDPLEAERGLKRIVELLEKLQQELDGLDA